MTGKRPDFPSNFPENLQTIVAKGWSHEAKDRPTIKTFLDECKELDDLNHDETAPTMTVTTMTVKEQTRSVGLETVPSPLISMRWKDNLEVVT